MKVNLLADGQEVPGVFIILDEHNNWRGSFNNLNKYEQGRKIEYSIQEVEIGEGYTTEITGSVEN